MEEKVKKSGKLKNFLKGIIKENPLFVMVLGTCPALATTTSIESAIGMGILFSIVLICSSVIISSLRKLIPEEIRTPAYIVIIATFVTIVKMLSNAFLPELYTTLGVFISLIVVNCIVLGRAEAYASKHGVLDSLLDALGMGVGYTFSLLILATIREVLGTGMITFGVIFPFIPHVEIPLLTYNIVAANGLTETIYDYSIPILTQPVGAFIVFGLVMGVIGFINVRKTEKEQFLKRFKGTLEPSVDDKRVNLSRVITMASAAVFAILSICMMFAPALSGDINVWNDVYFGSNSNIHAAYPAAVGYFLILVSAILATLAAVFNKNWTKKYIWLTSISGLLAIGGGILIIFTPFIFDACNASLISKASSLSVGSGLAASFAIISGILSVAGLLVPAFLDSYIVAHPIKEAESEVK